MYLELYLERSFWHVNRLKRISSFLQPGPCREGARCFCAAAGHRLRVSRPHTPSDHFPPHPFRTSRAPLSRSLTRMLPHDPAWLPWESRRAST